MIFSFLNFIIGYLGECDSEALLQADRLHDIIGAKKNNIASIGVTYGYGSREELETHKADLIADYPDEIPKLLPLILSLNSDHY